MRNDHDVLVRPSLWGVLLMVAWLVACAEEVPEQPDDPGAPSWTRPRQLAPTTAVDVVDGSPRPRLALARDGKAAYCAWLIDSAVVASWAPSAGWSMDPGAMGNNASEVAVTAGAERRGLVLWLGPAGIVDGVTQRGPLARPLGPRAQQASADVVDRYPTRLSRDFNPSANIVMNEAGQAAATWLAGDGLWSATRSSVSPWSAREAIAIRERTDEIGTDFFNPRLAIDRSGTVFVAWLNRIFSRATGTFSAEIVVRQRDPEGRWGPRRTLGLAYTGIVEPSLALDDDGNAIVLWSISNGTEGTLWAAHFDRQQGWGDTRRIALDPAWGAITRCCLAIAPDGRAVAVWYVNDSNQNRIRAFHYDRGGGWRQADDFAPPGRDARMPAVAAGRNGEFTAAWVERTGATARLWSNYFDGVRWASPERMPSTDTTSVLFPEVAMDDRGNTLAIWTESDLEGALFSSYRPARR